VSEIFGPNYANSYDQLYREKDYSAECDLLESVFQRYGTGPTSEILDLGCGTGNHAIPLGARGYNVTGIDRSLNMLSQAEKKAGATNGNGNLRFECGDIRTADLKRTFDASIMMFAVLSYQIENDDVRAALETARRHLRPGGLFLFDIWYGPAVLHERPTPRARVISTPEGEIIRLADGELDSQHQVCEVDIRLWQIAESKLVSKVHENHRMRYFFPMELHLFLQMAGFKLIRLGGFPDLDQEPAETTWNVLAVARAS
jgi:SAM-dependent methyltransferase